GGADNARISGEAPRSIPLWVVGGTGVNTLIDESVVGGRKSPTRLYDRGGAAEASVVVKAGEVALAKPDAAKDSTKEDEEPGKAKKNDGGYDPDTAWNRRPVVKFQGWE